ncbi:hypothetical protein A3F66_01160 [candidate division TM6 bacterium RIFCSPHIGHO2_12_FULL_32_22]|nr:MAG: hypothetical protein A3F66_01160 [candidate division TM6 bacterium RIFCSPHIGHO2_12_FULL_32_22]
MNENIIGLSEKYKLEKLLNYIKDEEIIMMGEATHGTYEFYKARAELTQRLIEEKKVTAVAVEGDWPSIYRVNKFVQGRSSDDTPFTSLAGIEQFPLWMWRNKTFLEFIIWLKEYNSYLEEKDRIRIYGLDLYSLHSSSKSVIEYLEKVDPKEAKLAKQRYNCFEKFGFDMQNYGYLTVQGLTQNCKKEVLEQLLQLQQNSYSYLKQDGFIKQEELFCAQQNAEVVKDAENYYQSIFFANSNISWNIRDTHMLNTLKAIYEHQNDQGKNAKIVVWAHNSHIGDSRATQFAQQGQVNIGQLARQNFSKENVFLLGFSTYNGTVSAASDWGAPVERKNVRAALEESYESYFHTFDHSDLLIFSDKLDIKPMLQRAIGVIYRPETERWSHYFMADLKNQFNAMIHYDNTMAVEPLEKSAEWERGEMPETYPFGL